MNNILLWGLGILVPGISMAAEKERPNIILIMADDMGWGDAGFNGNTVIRTPCLDALASDGMVLERFYSAAPLSSPTRASALTGRHPFRTGIFSANVGRLGKGEVTIAELLKNEGYATGLFGKWHLGTLTDKEIDANRARPKNKHLYNPPSWHGFEASFVTESKVPTYDPMIQPAVNDGTFWDYVHKGDSVRPYGTAYWDWNGSRVTEDVSGNDSEVIVDRVLPFVDQSVEKDVPFFSVVWFHAPHLPCVAGPEHVAPYKDLDLQQRNYYGCITAMDEQVGRLVDYLKSKQVYDNTIIFFCSDNGPELETPGSPGGFKGKKRSLYEGGIRVPSVMCWPARIPGGSRSAVPSSTLDYLPTLLDIIGIPSGDHLTLDGESIWPKVLDKSGKREKPMVFCSDRQGAVVDGDYKLYYSKGNYELYDIARDPGEKSDISSQFPEKKEKLTNYLRQNIEDYRQSFEKMRTEDSVDWQEWWNIWK